MKRIIYTLSCILIGYGTMYANDCDTLQCINSIMQVIDNATPVDVSAVDWNGDWYVDEWQRIEYLPGDEDYTYFHETNKLAQIKVSGSKGTLSFENYSIPLDDVTHSVIEVKGVKVKNVYGSEDYVVGKLVLLGNILYLHFRVVATQDYAVDLYGTNTGHTAISNVQTNDRPSSKLLHNGQLLILRDGKTYSVTGVEVAQ